MSEPKQPQQQPNQIVGYVVGNDLLRALLEYLQTRPFNEVADLIGTLMNQIKAQEAAAKAKESKAPKPAVDNAVNKAMEAVKNANQEDALAKKRKEKKA